MRKPKPQPEPAPPKRKRARRLASGDAAPVSGKAAGEKQYSDEDIRRIYRWVENNETPRVFAIVARQLGFVGARPRDFFCLCPPHHRTGVPVCAGENEGCPHAGRLSPEEIEATQRPGAHARMMARINRIVAARGAPPDLINQAPYR